MVKTEIIDSFKRFKEVREAWQDLWERSRGFIFQHHDWICGWFSGIQDRGTMRLLIAAEWDGDRLIAALPMAVERRRGLRCLVFAGQLFDDYCDALADPSRDQAVALKKLWDRLRRGRSFDIVTIQQVRPDAKIRPLLDGLSGPSGQLRVAPRQERCMRVENHWDSGHAFFRSLNKKGRNNHTRGKRILSELGGEPVFRVIEPPEDPSAAFDEIWRLKEIWLKAVEPESPLLHGDHHVLRSILDAAWHTGLARVFLLECGGKIAAGSINFIYDGRMEAYFTSYDAAFERASPGTILIVDYAQWAFDRGLKYVDFLRGDEAFKFRMANAETVLSNYEGYRSLVGYVAMSGHWLINRRKAKPEAETAVEEPAEELEPA